MSSQSMPVHHHLTMARALKGNDIPIFGSLPHRSSWGFVMRDEPLRTSAWEGNFLACMQGCQPPTSLTGEGMIDDIIMHGR